MALKLVRRLLVWIFLPLILIVIGIVAVAIFSGNALVKRGVEEVLGYALQVDVTLDSARLQPFRGKVLLHGLTIGNPEGFKTTSAFEMQTIEVAVDLKSFRTDTPTISVITFDSPKITLEQGLRTSNLKQLIENAERLSSGKEPATEEPAPEGSGKKVQVEEVVVENGRVALSAPLLQGQELTVPLPRIEMHDLGGKGEHVSIAEALRLFLVKIFTSTLDAGKSVMPQDLESSLRGSVDAVSSGVKETLSGVKDSLTGILNRDDE